MMHSDSPCTTRLTASTAISRLRSASRPSQINDAKADQHCSVRWCDSADPRGRVDAVEGSRGEQESDAEQPREYGGGGQTNLDRAASFNRTIRRSG
jgi:hypothetical protein